MGQTIQIWDADVVGDVLMVSTDRSLTGQDGESYRPGDPVDPEATFPAQLAGRLFEADGAIDHIYVMSNVISVRRPGGWSDQQVEAARSVVSTFFNFYGDTSTSASPDEGSEAPVADEPPV
jgi:hypothetical protein